MFTLGKALSGLAPITVISFTMLTAGCADDPAVAPSESAASIQLRTDVRGLWEEHVQWTRLVIVSAAAGLPDLDAAVLRLLRNQQDIGDAIKSYYGDAAGDALAELLRDHIRVAADLVAAAKAGDTAAFDAANALWYANGDDIADFLGAANPTHWPKEAMRTAMHHHLDTTLAEASARLTGDWQADIAAYDGAREHVLMMADTLAHGIAVDFLGTTGVAAKGTTRVTSAELQIALRKLWEEHVFWTRQVIVSFAAGLPDFDAAVARLLRNQDDLGDAIKPFYGDAAGAALTALLKDHILIAADILIAAKAGDAAGLETAKSSWYANGDDIADFLSAANPTSWPQAALRASMREHLDTTLVEATARLTGDWEADIAGYAAARHHMLALADMLAVGITAQFPALVDGTLPITHGAAH